MFHSALERLARKMVMLAEAMSPALGRRNASDVFVRAYAAVFQHGAQPQPKTQQKAQQKAQPKTQQKAQEEKVQEELTLLSDHGLSCAEVLDYCLLLAANLLDREYHTANQTANQTNAADLARATMYWAVQLLVVLHKHKGMRLHAALGAHGLSFSSPPSPSKQDWQLDRGEKQAQEQGQGQELEQTKLASDLATDSASDLAANNAWIWPQIDHAATQLCTMLTKPAPRVLAGLYNDIVAKCGLAVPPVAVADRALLRDLVRLHSMHPAHAHKLEQYVRTHLGGNRAHTLSIETYKPKFITKDRHESNRYKANIYKGNIYKTTTKQHKSDRHQSNKHKVQQTSGIRDKTVSVMLSDADDTASSSASSSSASSSSASSKGKSTASTSISKRSQSNHASPPHSTPYSTPYSTHIDTYETVHELIHDTHQDLREVQRVTVIALLRCAETLVPGARPLLCDETETDQVNYESNQGSNHEPHHWRWHVARYRQNCQQNLQPLSSHLHNEQNELDLEEVEQEQFEHKQLEQKELDQKEWDHVENQQIEEQPQDNTEKQLENAANQQQQQHQQQPQIEQPILRRNTPTWQLSSAFDDLLS